MKTSSPCTLVRTLLVAAATAALALGASAASLAEPTLESAVAVAKFAEGKGTVVAPHWTPQAAPGSTAAPAADARSQWLVLQGWTKVPVTGDISKGAESPELPDPWPRGRTYERAWYILRADLGRELPESLWLRFDAVAHQCAVFVNGQPAGHHLGGFTPFEFDLTRAAHPGLNTIAVFVRDEHAVETATPPRAVSQLGVTRAGAFNSAAGILGGVWLEKRAAVHVDHLLIQASTRRNELRVSTWLRGGSTAGATISHAVFAWPNGTTPVVELPAERAALAGAHAVVTVPWRDAQRWSPEHPNLYTLRTTVRVGGRSETVETRFGFREFWAEGRSFFLNGTPIRLLGSSVASDLRTAETPDVGRRYARDVLEFLRREFNYRAMRLHASIHPRYAVEAADEVGTLLIDQSGIWSAMASYYDRGGTEFLKNTEQQFAEWFWRDANNPSVVIWDVENEMIRDQRTPEREQWVLALDRFIKQHDPTRIVEHAGAAWYSPTQEDIHLHMQEQYSQALRTWAREGKVPMVIGEFWVGGRGGETRLPNAYEFADRLDWLQEESRQYREKILEMRNYGASAVMPFWLDRLSLGRTEPGVRRHYDSKTDRIYRWPVPGLVNLGGEALAPVVAFAWPRGGSIAAGGAVEREIVACNDREQSVTLTVSCDFAGQHQQWQATIGPSGQDRHRVSFAGAQSGKLVVTISEAGGRSLPGDALVMHAIAPEGLTPPKLTRRVVVVPTATAELRQALTTLGVPCETRATLPEDATGTLVVVPPDAAADALGRSGSAVRRYLAAGGRLLVLKQSQAPAWLPLTLPFWSAAKKSAPEFTMLGWPTVTRDLIFSREVALEASGHPAFAGLTPVDFTEWNPLDGRVADDAFARPSALDMRAGAPYRVLAGSARRENASVVESAVGSGTALFCQLQVVENREQPAARAVLFNLLRYLDGPAWRATERAIGIAGDLSPARVRALTGLAAESLVVVKSAADAPRVVLVGDKADAALLDALARAGHVVVVLSRDTAARLPGYAVRKVDRLLGGTRGRAVDEPLFWGVGTGSFLPLEQSPAKGVLSGYPKSARVVLGGLSGGARPGRNAGNAVGDRVEVMEGEAPLAVAETRGTGLLVVTTIEPWDARSEAQRQLLTTLLANAGVALPVDGERPAIVAVKNTVPLRFDGKLDDWTNDMEDRNVSAFQHATPIVLSSRDVVSGSAQGDRELSGVIYLLHDAARLYVGGIVFSTGTPRVELDFGDRRVACDLGGGGAVTVDGAAVPGAQVATGRQMAREVSDTRLLALTSFNAQIASMSGASDTSGRTFELALPLSALGLTTGQEVRARVTLSNASGAVLRVPAGKRSEGEPGLLLRLESR